MRSFQEAHARLLSQRPATGEFSGESHRIPISGRTGRNTVTIACSDWNHGKTTFAATDIRPMALFLRKLRLVSEK